MRDTTRQAVDFYSIEVFQLIDGALFVTMTATSVDDQEPQLLTQEITSERVASIHAALALTKNGLSG